MVNSSNAACGFPRTALSRPPSTTRSKQPTCVCAHSSVSRSRAGRLGVRRQQPVERLAASIRTGAVTASLIMRQLASYPRQNGVATALRELGRLRAAGARWRPKWPQLTKVPSDTHKRTEREREAVGKPPHRCFRILSHSDWVYRTGNPFVSPAECSYAYQTALSLVEAKVVMSHPRPPLGRPWAVLGPRRGRRIDRRLLNVAGAKP